RAISRNEGTQRTDEKLYQSSHERGNGERSHDTQSIESDSRKNGQSHEQHAINCEHARQDVRRKRREIASKFDKWTRGKKKKQKEKDKKKIKKNQKQHEINNEHERQDVRRKRREFASDFDKWTRGNGKEQQQDGKSSSRDAKIERGGIESDKQRNKHEHDE